MNLGLIIAGFKLLIRKYFSTKKRFDGTAKEICEQIVEKTWNGQFYQTGLGHFNYFWVRDFGIVVESLINTGNIERVKKTIGWALEKYIRAGRVALCIDKDGFVFDAPNESIDALPWLLLSISKSDYKLNNSQKKFIESEIKKFSHRLFDPKTGDILQGVAYSELRDAVNYKQSAYSVMMIYIFAYHRKKLKLSGFKFKPEKYKALLKDSYWNGKYFNSDINNDAFSAEGNLFPFVLGIFNDVNEIRSIFKFISKRKINKPFPMKYTDQESKFNYHWWGKLVMPNYAGSTVWTWMGAIYLQLLQEHSPNEFKIQLKQFTKVIEKNKNFPELLHPNGDWYETPLYRGEEGMIWAALYLDVANRL